jgi:predicted metalloprotease with PDZ domain
MLFNVPKGWMVATTLDPATDGATTGDAEFHQTSFNVDDYATLASSPLIAAPHFSAVQFTRDGVDYAVVAGGENAFPVDSFASATNQIARAENSFFGKVPYRRYLFVVYTGAEQPFGIAHGTSSVYTLPNGDWSAHAPAIEHLVAATMFKTWNGGQFHISQLGPVDFTEPIEARSLWFSEGVSEYYAELLRVRYGLITAPDFFTAIDNWEGLANGDGSGDTGSLESLSLRMKTFNPICVECLRARGSLAAMLMDIEIRDKTHRKHSLDNVLLRMDRDVRTGKTYNDAKFDKTLSAYSSVDLSAFYDRYICKSDVLPLEAYLEKMGAGSDVPDGMKTGNEFGLALALNTAGTAIIDAPENDSLEAEEVLADNKAKEMDLKPGDTVVAIDGENVSPESVEDAKARLAAGRLVKLALVRNAKAVPVRVKSKHPRTASDLRLALVSRPSAEQLALRNAIIGKRRLKRSKHAKFYAQTKGAR